VTGGQYTQAEAQSAFPAAANYQTLASRQRAGAPMVFKSIADSGLTVVATCAFIISACFVTQDHPVYIPQLLSAVTGRAGGR
jgi:hypothetical protein